MKSDRPEIAHIMRRAGFGATPSELDELTAEKTYYEIVDDLVNPERFPEVDSLYLELYYESHVGKWLYRMMNTERPLEEKIALLSLSHRPVGELTNTGVGAMGLKRGRPVQFHWPLVGPQKGRLPLLVPWGLGPAPRRLATAP